jgi:divalent metal cation (Fe/Co/Zn/Cd) transporter
LQGVWSLWHVLVSLVGGFDDGLWKRQLGHASSCNCVRAEAWHTRRRERTK